MEVSASGQIYHFNAPPPSAAPVNLSSSDAAVLISITWQSLNHNIAFIMKCNKLFIATHALDSELHSVGFHFYSCRIYISVGGLTEPVGNERNRLYYFNMKK